LFLRAVVGEVKTKKSDKETNNLKSRERAVVGEMKTKKSDNESNKMRWSLSVGFSRRSGNF
jgi:hypothetical protein